jgi:hypothetical protein
MAFASPIYGDSWLPYPVRDHPPDDEKPDERLSPVK